MTLFLFCCCCCCCWNDVNQNRIPLSKRMSSVMSNELCSMSRNFSLSIRSRFFVIVLNMVSNDSISVLLTWKKEDYSSKLQRDKQVLKCWKIKSLYFVFTVNFFYKQIIDGLMNGFSRYRMRLGHFFFFLCRFYYLRFGFKKKNNSISS